MDDTAPERDLWQQGGNPLLAITLYISTKARDRAFALDQRTVYRRNASGWEQVAVFKNEIDARMTVLEHNRYVNEKSYEKLHERIGGLIERIDSGTMGDPII